MSFTLEKGKTLAIVGESGCGKSTLGRILTLIDPQTSGELLDRRQGDQHRKRPRYPEMRRKVQIIFQIPYGSLNPRQKIGEVLGDRCCINTKTGRQPSDATLPWKCGEVGLGPKHYIRYPHCPPAVSASVSLLRAR